MWVGTSSAVGMWILECWKNHLVQNDKFHYNRLFKVDSFQSSACLSAHRRSTKSFSFVPSCCARHMRATIIAG